MSSSIQNGQSVKNRWEAVAPDLARPVAAMGAIVLPFRFFVQKTEQQMGLPVSKITIFQGIKGGIKAAPATGLLIGTQLALQKHVEKALKGESGQDDLLLKLKSSGIVGAFSSPLVAVFNGKGMGWKWKDSMREFNVRQGVAITLQETAFVLGISAGDLFGSLMKQKFGDNKVVDYSAVFIAGTLGGFGGHMPNTALTRWQNTMKVSGFRQLMWGVRYRAGGTGVFAACYKLGKEILTPTVKNST